MSGRSHEETYFGIKKTAGVLLEKLIVAEKEFHCLSLNFIVFTIVPRTYTATGKTAPHSKI
jgi:hypothetical protein